MKITLKSLLLGLFSLCIASISQAQVKEQTFEDYQKQESQSYQKYIEEETKAYEQYVKDEKEAFEKFRKEVEVYWGKGKFISSTQKDWVEYSEDKKSRTNVDFEKGIAKVEIILSPQDAEDSELVNKKVEESIKRLVTAKGHTKDFETASEKSKPLAEFPVLQGQLQTKGGKNVDAKNADSFAKEIVKKEKIEIEIIKGTDGKKRTKLTVSMALAPNHIKIRAAKYQNEINKYAAKYNLPVELVYAIIHTESYFNPKAKSHAPAYGLMQLVPRSGARDAYQYVYKKDRILPANYLYKAEKNIELGTAYLRLLMTRHFSNIKNPKSRMLCAIASYNTGAGNLARAFTGKTNPSVAVPIINGMSYDEVYSYLRKHLPYNETKAYIEKVSRRQKQYHTWKD